MKRAVVVGLALALAGCGNSDSTKTTSSVRTGTVPAAKTPHRNAKPKFKPSRASIRRAAAAAAAATVTPTPPPTPAPKPKPISTEAQACDLPVSVDRNACHDSYYSCSVTAKPKVEAYYASSGPSIDSVAIRYAKGFYTLAGAWQAGYAGCLAALNDEYKRLYG